MRRCVAARPRPLRRLYHASTMQILRAPGKQVFVVGTSHVSAESAQQVREVIRGIQPEAVLLELCDERARQLEQRSRAGPPPRRALDDMLSRLLGSSAVGAAGAAMDAIRGMLDSVSGEPGGEFVAAVEEARMIAGCAIVNADLPARVTMEAVTAKLPGPLEFMQRMMTSKLDLSGLSANKNQVVVRVLRVVGCGRSVTLVVQSRENARRVREALAVMAPEAIKPLLDDRDAHMARVAYEARQSRMVMVVGLMHMDGIEREFARLVDSRS